MLMTKPRSSPSTPVRVRSPHSITITASPGSSMRVATSILDTPGNTDSGPGAGSLLTIRTSLPSDHSAYAIACCEPMASPSGRTCDESTKRCRLRISSAIRPRVVVSVAASVIRTGFGTRDWGLVAGRALGVLFVDVAEDLLDAVLVRDRLVEPELDLRYAPELQAGFDLAPGETGRAPQGAGRLLAGVLIAEARVEDTRHLE